MGRASDPRHHAVVPAPVHIPGPGPLPAPALVLLLGWTLLIAGLTETGRPARAAEAPTSSSSTTTTGEPGATLASHREAIDAIDARLVELLNERAAHAAAIGSLKRGRGLDAYVPVRERQVLERISSLNRGPFPNDVLHAVYREIMSGSLALEQPPRVAFLGPAATFTHQAARTRFGTGANYLPHESVDAVVRAVLAGEATYGVVAYHNSTEGAVSQTLDTLARAPASLRVIAEVELPVEHALATRARSLADIRRLHVHAQTRAQCRGWIERHLPGVELVDSPSNARSAERAAADRHAAALCGPETAAHYHVPVLARGAQDDPANTTRFLVLARSPALPQPTGRDRTTLVVESHGPGRTSELDALLGILRRHEIPVTGIHSRPQRGPAGGQWIFLDCQAHDSAPGFAAALEQIHARSGTGMPGVRSLGGHPAPAQP